MILVRKDYTFISVDHCIGFIIEIQRTRCPQLVGEIDVDDLIPAASSDASVNFFLANNASVIDLEEFNGTFRSVLDR